MYTRSPAAYEGLKSFKRLQLPSVHTLKHYAGANLEQERRQYLVMVEEKRRALEEKRQKKKNQSGIV